MTRWCFAYVASIVLGALTAMLTGAGKDSVYSDADALAPSTAVLPTEPSRLGAKSNQPSYFRVPPPNRAVTVRPAFPAADLPLANAYPALKRLADLGDAPAACRLAGELNWCLQVRVGIESEPLEHRARKRRSLDQDGHCMNVSDDQYREALGLLRQAAVAGSQEAMETYVKGTLFQQDPEVASEYLQVYQSEAFRLAEAGVRAGSVSMLEQLRSAYAGHRTTWLARTIGDDYDGTRYVLLDLLWVRIPEAGQTVDLSEAAMAQNRLDTSEFTGLPLTIVEQLDDIAAVWYRDWFQGKTRSEAYPSFEWTPSGNGARPDFSRVCSERYLPDPLSMPALSWPEE